jgi:hypothetical protein
LFIEGSITYTFRKQYIGPWQRKVINCTGGQARCNHVV